MNLYKIIVKHCAPRDCHDSIACLLLAKDDETVYNWLYKGYGDLEETYVGTDYEFREDETFTLYDEDFKKVGEETFKERVIRLKGLINDDEEEYEDLFYGKVVYGWKLLVEDFSDLESLKDLVKSKVVIVA